MQLLSVHTVVFGVLHHKLIDLFRRVILIELVELYDLYQLRSVLGVGGIAGSLQALGPALIVGHLQAKQAAVALTAYQEAAVVLKRLVG